MKANTSFGNELERISHHLNTRAIEHEVHFQEGTVVGQAQRVIERGNYDLIVIGADPPGRLRRWVLGEIVTPLLQSIDKPLLIAKVVKSE